MEDTSFTNNDVPVVDGGWDNVGWDGTVDRIWKKGHRPIAAIFIHAGAGYHSTTNERVHLEACAEAAKAGMKALKRGSPSPEAVEAAIRSLEDKEITNAGFGSNLNMDGVVECDATIVDHLGRSGACGAVPGIKNPISLAKLILDASNQPLSLRRVPPNLLVGMGAKSFAEEHGLMSASNDSLVSRNARDRYNRWNEDLKRAESKLTVTPRCTWTDTEVAVASAAAIAARTPTPSEYENTTLGPGTAPRRDHLNAILTGTWNEGQPDSPYRGGSPVMTENELNMRANAQAGQGGPSRYPLPNGRHAVERSPLSYMSPFHGRMGNAATKQRPLAPQPQVAELSATASGTTTNFTPDTPAATHDSAMETEDQDFNPMDYADLNYDGNSNFEIHDGSDLTASPSPSAHNEQQQEASLHNPAPATDSTPQDDDDMITDTIGVIAIDMDGNICAGSSSGGIGMKHSGRVGPAALVGIGTAVLPESSHDETATSVAVVTSGTGEHMATSMASYRCAERLLHSTRRGPDGRDVDEPDDHALMQAFIQDDFMGHPGVRNQSSPGAIGVMAVKKTRGGVYFYFAHNTDSFALASFSSVDREPACVMSRLREGGQISQGARKVALS